MRGAAFIGQPSRGATQEYKIPERNKRPNIIERNLRIFFGLNAKLKRFSIPYLTEGVFMNKFKVNHSSKSYLYSYVTAYQAIGFH